MKKIRIFLSENFPFLVVKFSICWNRRVFVMCYSFPQFQFRYLLIEILFIFVCHNVCSFSVMIISLVSVKLVCDITMSFTVEIKGFYSHHTQPEKVPYDVE